jgi:hypothetical protein
VGPTRKATPVADVVVAGGGQRRRRVHRLNLHLRRAAAYGVLVDAIVSRGRFRPIKTPNSLVSALPPSSAVPAASVGSADARGEELEQRRQRRGRGSGNVRRLAGAVACCVSVLGGLDLLRGDVSLLRGGVLGPEKEDASGA